MNKILLILKLLCLIFFSSCTDEEELKKEDNSIRIENSELEIKTGEQKQINATSVLDISYYSENDFYASVDRTGLVTANKVGETDILLNNGVNEETVNIIIKPHYTTYPDPYLDFNASKNDIIKNMGEPDVITEDGNLVYTNYSSKANIGMYIFDGSKYEAFVVQVMTNYASELGQFISERYNLYYEDEENYTIYYINAETFNEASVVVGVQVTLSGINVAYMPVDILSQSISEIEIVKDLFLNLNKQ